MDYDIGPEEIELPRSPREEDSTIPCTAEDVMSSTPDPIIQPHELHDLRFVELCNLVEQGRHDELLIIAERLIHSLIHCCNPNAHFPDEKDMDVQAYTNEIMTLALLMISLAHQKRPPKRNTDKARVDSAILHPRIASTRANALAGEWALMIGKSCVHLCQLGSWSDRDLYRHQQAR
jgi:hypothetical protein